MRLLGASKNIFPACKENFVALLNYYFPYTGVDEKNESLQLYLAKKQALDFRLNQIEFGARLCRENEVLLDLRGFSSIPAIRIYYLLISLFVPVEEWDKLISKAHKERLLEFRRMVTHQPELLKRVDAIGFSACVFPKIRENLITILDKYFPEAEDEERQLSLKHFLDNRETLSSIHYAAQFCAKNKIFLDEAGVTAIPSERIHRVLTAIFYPDYTWLPGEFEKEGAKYEDLKMLYFQNISSHIYLNDSSSKTI